jgi:osmoprotectant transport system ATP-binding protein
VLSTGAHVEQQGAPVELLASPANEFVSGFLGEDRTLRSLSLRPGAAIDIHGIESVTPGWTIDQRGSTWWWTNVESGAVTGAPSVGPSASMRSVLDGVLAAPHGWVLRVDDHDALIGVSSLADVERAQRRSLDPGSPNTMLSDDR